MADKKGFPELKILRYDPRQEEERLARLTGYPTQPLALSGGIPRAAMPSVSAVPGLPLPETASGPAPVIPVSVSALPASPPDFNLADRPQDWGTGVPAAVQSSAQDVVRRLLTRMQGEGRDVVANKGAGQLPWYWAAGVPAAPVTEAETVAGLDPDFVARNPWIKPLAQAIVAGRKSYEENIAPTVPGRFVSRVGDVGASIVAPGGTQPAASTDNKALDTLANILGYGLGVAVPGGAGQTARAAVRPAAQAAQRAAETGIRAIAAKVGPKAVAELGGQGVTTLVQPILQAVGPFISRRVSDAVGGAATLGGIETLRQATLGLTLEEVPMEHRTKQVVDSAMAGALYSMAFGALQEAGAAIVSSTPAVRAQLRAKGYAEARPNNQSSGVWYKGTGADRELVIEKPNPKYMAARIDMVKNTIERGRWDRYGTTAQAEAETAAPAAPATFVPAAPAGMVAGQAPAVSPAVAAAEAAVTANRGMVKDGIGAAVKPEAEQPAPAVPVSQEKTVPASAKDVQPTPAVPEVGQWITWKGRKEPVEVIGVGDNTIQFRSRLGGTGSVGIRAPELQVVEKPEMKVAQETAAKKPVPTEPISVPVAPATTTVQPKEEAKETSVSVFPESSHTPWDMNIPTKPAPTPTTDAPAPDPPVIAPITSLPIAVSKDDIPYDLAKRAYSAISWVPEKRAEQAQQEYVNHMESIYEQLLPLATTPEKQEMLKSELEKYRDGYLKRYRDILSAKSRTMSPMITGSSKFPVARNQKALDSERKKVELFLEWQKKAVNAMLRKLGGGPTSTNRQIISSDDADALEKLQANLEKLEKLQEIMKAANAIVRKKNLSDEEKVKQLQRIEGISESHARKLLEPDFAGRVGFPSYQLTNNNSEIRRLKQRIEELRQKQADTTQEVVFIGGKIVDNVEDNRVQIFFDEKPDEAMRKELKSNGFRWAPSIEAWQRHRSDHAINLAKRIVGMPEDAANVEATATEVWQRTKGEFVTTKQGPAKELQEYEHRQAVEQALKDSKPVPAEVLKDYPELTEKAEGKPLSQVNAKDGIPMLTPTKETAATADQDLAYEDFSPAQVFREAKKQLTPSRREAVSKEAIARKIQQYFGTPIRLGRFRGRQTLAIYKNRPEVIRAKVKNARSIRVLTHELGHHLDKLLGLSTEKHHVELLNVPYVQSLAREKPNAPAKLLRQEGVAEFVKMYLMEPEQAASLLPNFYADFEDKMTLHPDIQDKLLDLRKMIATYGEQNARAKIASFIGEEPRKNQFSINKAYDYIVDELGPIARMMNYLTNGRDDLVNPEDDPYKAFRLAKGYHGKAHLFVRHGQYVWDSQGNAKKVGPSLAEIQQPIAKLGDKYLDDFTYYIVAKRAVEIEEKGKVSGLDRDDAEAFIAEIENGPHGELFQNQMQELIKYNRFILQQMVGTSLSQDQYDQIVAENKFYTTPFYRARSDIPAVRGDGGNRFANRGRGVQRLKGADLPIKDPWQNIVRQTFALTGLADKMKAMQKLVGLKDSFEGTGKFFDAVPTPKIPLNVNMAEIMERLADLGGIDAEMPEMDIQEIMLTLFKPQGIGNVHKNLLTVWFDGKPQFYDFVDADLMRAVMHMDSEQVTAFGKLGRATANLMRVGHTMNPRFLFYNPARDQFLAGAYSKHGYRPWYDFMRGVFQTLGQGEMFKEWLLAGGAMSTYDTFDRNYLEKSLKPFMHRKWQDIVKDAINPLTYLRYLASMSEYSTNLGEYMRAKEVGKHWVDASMAGRDITVDHARHGSKTGPVRDFVAFFNSAIQGHDKMIREFKKAPGRTMWRFFFYITLPAIGLYLLNRKNPNYHELPAWRRDLFFNLPIGDPNSTRTFLPLPKPFVPGFLFGTMPEKFLQYVEEKDPKVFEGWAAQLRQIATPNTTVWPLELVYEWKANRNFYTGAPIVPAREERLPAGEQYGPYTSETAKLLGSVFDVSPRKIDHAVRKVTGILGSTATQGTDALLQMAGVADPTPRPAASITDYPIIGDFFTQTRATGAATIDRFYDDLAKAEQVYASERGARNKQEAIYVLVLPELRRISRELSEIRALERRIHKATTWEDIFDHAPPGVDKAAQLTGEEKRRALEYLELAQINIVRNLYGKEPIPIRN